MSSQYDEPQQNARKSRTEYMPYAIAMVSEVAKAHGIPYELVADIVNDLQSKGVVFLDRGDHK